MRILRDDNTEVEIGESVDYGNTDFNSIMNEDSRHYDRKEFGAYGYAEQEIRDGEFQDVEVEEISDDAFMDDSIDE